MKTLSASLLSITIAASAAAQDGLTLYQPFGGTTTYLIDGSGSIATSWPGTTVPALSVYLTPEGDLLRTRKLVSNGPGSGGGFERISYDGTVEWQHSFFSSTITPHHDVELLPNGNVLVVAWEEIGGAAAIAAGRDPATVGSSFLPDAVFEIQPVGLTGGNVVWEWHAIDHVVQDFDAGLPGFGVIADYPELIDINAGPSGDWMHVNGIDYNPEFDQVAISVPHFNEVWIIDHSTTTAEAAGHSGGASGKGGDLLYRWGNPAIYGRGTVADQVFYFLHDVQWIEPGLPGAGNLMVYNNGNMRPTGNWSSIDEWTPPVDAQGNYSLAPGAAFGPSALAWTYSDQGNFHSNIMSGAQRLENGNTMIVEATAGRIFEVTDLGATVWTYINPFGSPTWVFKATRYADCDDDGVFDGHEIASGAETDLDGDGVVDGCQGPSNYCDALPNSSGLSAAMGWAGSTSVAANDLDLMAQDCPPGVLGIFAFGPTQGSTPLGDGLLCLAPPVLRLGVVQTSPAGLAQQDFDGNSLPAGSPAWAAGVTWNFTFWFRDPSGGPAGFNLSDGLIVPFVP